MQKVDKIELTNCLGNTMYVTNVGRCRGSSSHVEVTAEIGNETIVYHCPADQAPRIHDRVTVYVGENRGPQR